MSASAVSLLRMIRGHGKEFRGWSRNGLCQRDERRSFPALINVRADCTIRRSAMHHDVGLSQKESCVPVMEIRSVEESLGNERMAMRLFEKIFYFNLYQLF